MSQRVSGVFGSGLVERISTSTRATGAWVVDGEALLGDGVFEVNRSSGQVRDAHLVDNNFNAVVFIDCVALEQALVEVELVDQTRASPWLNGDAQPEIVRPSCSSPCPLA